MGAFRNRVGERYGRLVVYSLAERSDNNKVQWLCICDCGNTKIVKSDNLSSGKSNSCGCLKMETDRSIYPDRLEQALKVKYLDFCKRQRIIGGSLSYKEYTTIVTSSCFYCGCNSSNCLIDPRDKTLKGMVCGIDRLDSDLGYTLNNVVACCKTCNWAKGGFDSFSIFSTY